MFSITVDIAGVVHEYAGEGAWVQADGLRFATRRKAEALLKADLWRVSPRIRGQVQVDRVPD